MLDNFFESMDTDQRETIDRIRASFALADVKRILDSFSEMGVLVVGEPIVDTYVFCEAAGLSSKSPTVSVRALRQEDYAGGSLAIANHLAHLGCRTSLLITHGDEPYFNELLRGTLHPSITLKAQVTPGTPTPRKTRYLIPFQLQKIFEILNIREDQWKRADAREFTGTLMEASYDKDMAIIADFGHGLFEGPVLSGLKDLKPFIALNVQTNSANFGYNPFTKHVRYDYLSIDERECRVATHDRFTPVLDLARETIHNRVLKPASVTLGVSGSLYFDRERREHRCPSLFRDVIDTTGAGDAYFTLTSLLVKARADSELVPFLGNCYAGLKSRIVGNKKAVSKEDLSRLLDLIWDS